MTSVTIIENKLSSVEKYLKILAGYQKYSQSEIESSVDLKGAVERYLYLAIQSTIELAESLIAYKKLRKPSTMSEAFHILHEEEVISADMAEALVKMTGFRNVVSHDYEKLNYDIVYAVLKEKLRDIEQFLAVVRESY